jgi:hypothetical protein
MDVTSSPNVTAGIYALKQTEDVKERQVLGALGMTPETQNAEKQIENSMKQGVAQATGQGMGLDIQA